MKNTLPGSSPVRNAAMSAFRSRAGPAVWTSGAESSEAMMWASEVLPSPGGPASRTWSSASSRRRAASMKIASWSVTCDWPTKSSSVGGRSERSKSSSAPTGPGVMDLDLGVVDSGGLDPLAGFDGHAALAPDALRSADWISSSALSPSARSSRRSASAGV